MKRFTRRVEWCQGCAPRQAGTRYETGASTASFLFLIEWPDLRRYPDTNNLIIVSPWLCGHEVTIPAFNESDRQNAPHILLRKYHSDAVPLSAGADAEVGGVERASVGERPETQLRHCTTVTQQSAGERVKEDAMCSSAARFSHS
ncbi:MAG TPA: hypothetical protein VKT75_05570, partial [Acidobacteriaceae bacterium]|nr:hypothetical protein [Acidobacteriaceae bacterium]